MHHLSPHGRFIGRIVLAAAVGALALSAVPGRPTVAQADSSVISLGAPLPITGPLAPFGPIIKVGYQRAVDDANAAGGVTIGGQHKTFALVVRDSQSQPNVAAQEARTLVDESGVTALLGSVSPPLTVPVSTVAETKHIPMVSSLTPIEAWGGANPQGWKYAWDLFFAESQMTDLQFQAADLVKTNKRVALFTDNEQDGAVMGGLWTAKAPKFGYTIAYHATFPVGTTDYGSFIAEAKKANASVVIAQMIPPDAFALWKQMKSLGYAPSVAFCEKCGDTRAWPKELGPIGNGTMSAGWWSPALGRPQTKEFVDAYSREYGNTVELGAIVATYTAAHVLIDAIKRAGSTDPEKINAALAQTDNDAPLSRIKFNDKHQAAVAAIMQQWQGESMPLVYPRLKSAAAVAALGLGH